MKAIIIGLTIIVLAVAGVVVSVNRANIARDNAAAAQAAADKTEAEAKIAKRNADAEADRKRTAEAEANAAADKAAAQREEKERAKHDAEINAANKATAEANAKAEHDKLEAAQAERDAERAKLETAREERAKAQALAAAERSKAEAEADRLAADKLRAEKVIVEAKLLELRKIDYETWQRDLLELKQDLEERERALQPEKTISDLAWAGGMEDTVFDGDGKLTKKVKEPYMAEKDMSLPEETRRLAKAQRLAAEWTTESASRTRDEVVAAVEKLYVAALKDGRVIDAEFYKKTLKSMYPDWEFKGESDQTAGR